MKPRSEKVLLAKSGSHHLAKGKLIVLDKGQAEEWQVLAQEGQEPKRLKRLHKGRPLSVMVGKSETEDAVHFPAVTYAWKVLRLEATGYDPGPEANGQGNQGTTYSGTRARFGIVAVDPKVIPLKNPSSTSRAMARPRPWISAGPSKEASIDLCFNSTREAEALGPQENPRFPACQGSLRPRRTKCLMP